MQMLGLPFKAKQASRMTAKLTLVVLVCFATAILANPLQFDAGPADQALVRRVARSPQGNVDIRYEDGDYGKHGSVQYNQRVYSGDDGRFNVDAYASASRDFTHNRNDYGGGIMGSWRF